MDKVYSVSQVNSYIKRMFANDFALSRISVQGEISNCKYHSSGHIYFTLKDQGSTLSAVMWASLRKGLSFELKDGMQVVVTGSVEVYERGGSYQIYAQTVKQAGLGDLYEKFLQMKEKLEDMGMFAEEYKKPIPEFAASIGIATASTGAAVQDIINVATRRNPYVQLVFVPTKVQGVGAAESIAASIKALDDYGVDVIIVGRGGGSIEDLWAFNEETVARAIFNCRTPIISAVGHETDFTIADYVADMRAPTPSAAAELATVDMGVWLSNLYARADEMARIMNERISSYKALSERALLRLQRMSPDRRLNEYRSLTEEARIRMLQAIKDALVQRKHELKIKAERLNGISPLKKISSGYAWVSDDKEKHIKKAADIKKGDSITVRFADGKIHADVTEVSYE